MGDTWGDAIMTKIRVDVGGDVMERWVAVVSGGYDATSDPNEHAAYDPDSRGALDLGARPEDGPAAGLAQVRHGGQLRESERRGEQHRREADVLRDHLDAGVYDADGDSFADVIYAARPGRQRLEVGDQGAARAVGRRPRPSQPATTGRSASSSAPSPTTTAATIFYKSFYFPPAGTRKNGKIWLAFGSGERNDLLYMSDPGTTDDNNRFYVVEEIDLFDRGHDARCR